jgi:hypothetical protein
MKFTKFWLLKVFANHFVEKLSHEMVHIDAYISSIEKLKTPRDSDDVQ